MKEIENNQTFAQFVLLMIWFVKGWRLTELTAAKATAQHKQDAVQ